MTAVWDIVQAFLTGIGEAKDPENYATALEFMKRLVSDIHGVDHDQVRRSPRPSRGRRVSRTSRKS